MKIRELGQYWIYANICGSLLIIRMKLLYFERLSDLLLFSRDTQMFHILRRRVSFTHCCLTTSCQTQQLETMPISHWNHISTSWTELRREGSTQYQPWWLGWGMEDLLPTALSLLASGHWLLPVKSARAEAWGRGSSHVRLSTGIDRFHHSMVLGPKNNKLCHLLWPSFGSHIVSHHSAKSVQI